MRATTATAERRKRGNVVSLGIRLSVCPIQDVQNPIGRQEAATKTYVDTAVKKPIVALWAEQKGSLTAGHYEFSFGNGIDGELH